MPMAGRIRLDTNNIEASGPTPCRWKDPRSSNALSSPSVNSLRWPGEPHREPPTGVHGVVQSGIRTLEIPIIDGARVGDDVGVVGARHQDGDTETERRDLDRHRLAPPLHCALGRRVRRGGRLTAHTSRAGYQYDSPFTRRAHGRQQRLSERDRTQARWWQTSSATTPCRFLPPCRRRIFPHCVLPHRVHRRLLRSPWPPR